VSLRALERVVKSVVGSRRKWPGSVVALTHTHCAREADGSDAARRVSARTRVDEHVLYGDVGVCEDKGAAATFNETTGPRRDKDAGALAATTTPTRAQAWRPSLLLLVLVLLV
jgi:hypothetical protein